MNLVFINKYIQVFTCASILFTIGDLYLEGGVQTSWTGQADGDDNSWENADNWSNGVPTENDNAFLEEGNNITDIKINQNASVSSLSMGNGSDSAPATITIGESLSLTFEAMGLVDGDYSNSNGIIKLTDGATLQANLTGGGSETTLNNNTFAGNITSIATTTAPSLSITSGNWRLTGNVGATISTDPQVAINISDGGSLSYRPYFDGTNYHSLGYGLISVDSPDTGALVFDSQQGIGQTSQFTVYNPITLTTTTGIIGSINFNGTVQLSGAITVPDGDTLILRKSGATDADSGYAFVSLAAALSPNSGTFDLVIDKTAQLQITENGSISGVRNLEILYDNEYNEADHPIGLYVYATNQILSTGYTQVNASVDVQYVTATMGYLWGDDMDKTAQINVGTSGFLTIAGDSLDYVYPDYAFPGQFIGSNPVTLSGYSTRLGGDNTSFAGGFILLPSAHVGLADTKYILPEASASTFGVQMQTGSYLDFDIGVQSKTNFQLDGDCYFNVKSTGSNVTLLSGALTTTTTATLQKVGAGPLTINSAVTVGPNIAFTLIEGTLTNNATVLDTVTVAGGATLAGTGTYGSTVTAESGSTLQVGSSGTFGGVMTLDGADLTVNGQIVLSLPSNGSFSGIQGTSGGGDVTLGSQASLNILIPQNFSTYGTHIPFISLADGAVTGSFSTIGTGPFGLLDNTVAQLTPGERSITVNPISYQQFQKNFKSAFNNSNALQSGSSLISHIRSSSSNQLQALVVGFAANQSTASTEVGDSIQYIPQNSIEPEGQAISFSANQSNTFLSNPTYEIFSDLLYLPDINALNDALNQMQPALYKGMVVVQENNAVKIQNTLFYRFEQELNEVFCHRFKKEAEEQPADTCEKDTKNFHVWAAGFGDSLHQKSTHFAGSSQLGYNSNTGGITIGVDQRFAQHFYVGALGGYTDSSIEWTSDQGHGDLETGYAGLYLSGISDMFYGNVSVIGGWSSYDAHRNIEYGTVDETAKTNHGGSQILTHADTGINLGWKGFTIRPFDAFDYIAQTENGFTEHGAGVYNLKVKKSNAIMVRNELGLEFAGCMCVGNSRWTVSPKISWVREVRTKGKSYKAKLVDTDTYASYTGYFPDRSLASPGVLISGLMWKDRLALDLYYNGEFAHKYADHNYGGEIRFGF